MRRDGDAIGCRWNDEQEVGFKVASQMASSASLPNSTTMLSNKICLNVFNNNTDSVILQTSGVIKYLWSNAQQGKWATLTHSRNNVRLAHFIFVMGYLLSHFQYIPWNWLSNHFSVYFIYRILVDQHCLFHNESKCWWSFEINANYYRGP